MINLNKFNEALNEAIGFPQEVKEQVQTAIDAYIKEHGDSFDIYADYNDEIDDRTFEKWFRELDRPQDGFYDCIIDGEWYEHEEYNEILKNLELPEEIKEEYSMDIMDMLRDQISYNLPYDHYNKELGFDVYFKVPEYNKDTVEWSKAENKEQEKIDSIHPSIIKLIQSQGYTEEEFIKYYETKLNAKLAEEQAEENDQPAPAKPEIKEVPFFNNLIEEIENCTYEYGNEFVMLGHAPFLEMCGAMEEGKEITIPADCMCGLHNAGNGSGSTLNITLEKPITGKIGTDFDVFMKDAYGYTVDETHGLVAGAWDNHEIVIKE